MKTIALIKFNFYLSLNLLLSAAAVLFSDLGMNQNGQYLFICLQKLMFLYLLTATFLMKTNQHLFPSHDDERIVVFNRDLNRTMTVCVLLLPFVLFA